MREIKFRAWHTIHEHMYEHKAIPVLLKNVADNSVWKYMQFTGLKDKNGKEIYEGDICRVLYTDWGSKEPDDPRTIDQYLIDISRVGTVEFFNYEWSFNFGLNKYGEDSYGPLLTGTHGRIELIGNIYENPDLINPT